MTNKEAIEILNRDDNDMRKGYFCINDFEAIYTLKGLQEPKTVIYEGDGYANGNLVYDYARCPRCDSEYEEDDTNWKLPFCPNCGQALKWDEEGEDK